MSKLPAGFIDITYAWDEGGELWFDPAPIQPPQFRLAPRGDGSYDVVFNQGRMVQCWEGVVLSPYGKTALPAISGLPPYDGTLATQKMYQDKFSCCTSGGDYVCLEGRMNVIYKGTKRQDRVRLFVLPGAVTNPNGSTSDLILVTLAFADNTGGAFQENGGGSGPPH